MFEPPRKREWRFKKHMLWLKPYLQSQYEPFPDQSVLELNIPEQCTTADPSNDLHLINTEEFTEIDEESKPFTLDEMPLTQGNNDDENIEIKMEIEDTILLEEKLQPIADLLDIPTTSKTKRHKKGRKRRNEERRNEEDEEEGIIEIMIPNFWETPKENLVIKSETEAKKNETVTRSDTNIPKRIQNITSTPSSSYCQPTKTNIENRTYEQNKTNFLNILETNSRILISNQTTLNLPKNLSNNPESSSNLLKKNIINIRASSPINISHKKKTEQDPLDLFFSSMAATVKQFSPFLQHVAKTKIFSIITELEMQHYTQQNPNK